MFEFEAKDKEYVTKTFRLPKEMTDKLTRLASESNISLNEAIRQATCGKGSVRIFYTFSFCRASYHLKHGIRRIKVHIAKCTIWLPV